MNPAPFFLLMRSAYQEVQTPGKLYLILYKELELNPCWHTLEAKWNNNFGGCFPEGLYTVVREYSDKFMMDLWELKNVPDRSECKLHWGNYYKNYDGCVGVGRDKADINNDGYTDITDTKNAIIELMEVTKQYKFLPLVVTGPLNGWTFPNQLVSFSQAFS